MNFIDALQFELIRNALYAGLLASLACGIMGTFIVVKKLVFITGGISHASFGGVGLAFYTGMDPLLGAGIFAVGSALAIGSVGKRTIKSEDTAIGILWVVGMALGYFFVKLTPGYGINVASYLFGNLVLISRADVYFLMGLDLFLLVFVGLFYYQLQAVSFDEDFAWVMGVPTTLLYYAILILSALTVIFLMRFIGIILVIALITLPAAISSQFTNRLNHMMVFSTILAGIFTVSGLWLSYEMDWETGATIVIIGGAVFLLVTVMKKGWAKIWENRASK